MSKDTKLKTRCPKKYALKESEVASIAGVSVSYVKKLRAATVNTETPQAQRVLTIDELANQNKSNLIQEIKRIVNF